jgi:hypothetical protein
MSFTCKIGDSWRVCKLLCKLPPNILHVSDPPAVHPAHVPLWIQGEAGARPYPSHRVRLHGAVYSFFRLPRRLSMVLAPWGHFIMWRKQLLGIARRAETRF